MKNVGGKKIYEEGRGLGKVEERKSIFKIYKILSEYISNLKILSNLYKL